MTEISLTKLTAELNLHPIAITAATISLILVTCCLLCDSESESQAMINYVASIVLIFICHCGREWLCQ